MNYSVTIAGILGAVALPLLGEWGFSEACSQQIMGIGVPYFLSLPGLVIAYIGRQRHGDLKLSGAYKHKQ